jgi:hypothetical protein
MKKTILLALASGILFFHSGCSENTAASDPHRIGGSVGTKVESADTQRISPER